MWRVGDEVEVRVHSRTDARNEVRGTIVLADLTGVVKNLPPGPGANGPLSPVTQYLLREAAAEMTKRIGQFSATPQEHEDRIIRVLSMLVGHEPYVTNTLDLSVHQMRRRWPVAADWYEDLVRYILHATMVPADMRERLSGSDYSGLTLGQFIETAVEKRASYAQPELLYLAQTIQSMWPTYEPVRESVLEAETRLMQWASLVEKRFAAYGLALRPGVSIGEVFWAFHALATTEERRSRSRRVSPLFAGVTAQAPGRPDLPYAARTTMLVLSGSLVDAADGRALSLTELYDRREVGSAS